MGDCEIGAASLRSGVWSADLVLPAGTEPPPIVVRHLDQPLDGVAVAKGKTRWTVTVPVPPALISDGVQTFVVCRDDTGEVLGRFSIVAGEPLEADLRAELDLLRAELDLLKRAFRRHCSEEGHHGGD